MSIDQEFEIYRSLPRQPVTLPRLLAGLLIIGGCWLGTCLVIIIPAIFLMGATIDTFFLSAGGVLTLFATFLGIWLGVWLAMRYLHREPLGNLFGATGEVNRSDFCKGFAAVCLTSVVSEVLVYLVHPEFSRTAIDLPSWLTFLVPVALLCLVQTSSEEILFRGYLMRNLANCFRSPWIWAVLPAVAFVAMHCSPDMALADLILVVLSIGSLTVALVLVAYRTGNLGAAFGIHFGNNLFAFLLVAHQDEFGAFALFRGAPIDQVGEGFGKVWLLGAIAMICVGLTLVLLLHRASPLRLALATPVGEGRA